jgi:hypothetical protein
MENIKVQGRFGLCIEYIPVHTGAAVDSGCIQAFLAAITGVRPICGTRFVPTKVGQGSFSGVWVHDDMCARFTDIREGTKFINKLASNTDLVTSLELISPDISYGWVNDHRGNSLGFIIFMPRFDAVQTTDGDLEGAIFSAASKLAEYGFHNDLKIDNIMKDVSGGIHIIDYDLFSPTVITVSVNSYSFITVDLTDFFRTVDIQENVHSFRLFYDYSYLSLSVTGDSPLYAPILLRVTGLFRHLQDRGILDQLIEFLGETQIRDMPIEILAKCEIDAVSVNLLDPQGNAFAHGLSDWETYPSLVRSNGVYWPDR